MAQLTDSELLTALLGLTGTLSSQDVVTDPAAAALLADTGQLEAGKYLFQVFGSSSVAGAFDIEHRNAANGANVRRQRFHLGANAHTPLPVALVLTLATNERVRVISVAALVGNVHVTISRTRIGEL